MNRSTAHRMAVEKAKADGHVACPSIAPCKECRTLAGQLGLPVRRPVTKGTTMIRPARQVQKAKQPAGPKQSSEILVYDANGVVLGSLDPKYLQTFSETGDVAKAGAVLVFDARRRLAGTAPLSRIRPFASPNGTVTPVRKSAAAARAESAYLASRAAYRRDRAALPLTSTAPQRQLVEAVGMMRGKVLGRQAR